LSCLPLFSPQPDRPSPARLAFFSARSSVSYGPSFCILQWSILSPTLLFVRTATSPFCPAASVDTWVDSPCCNPYCPFKTFPNLSSSYFFFYFFVVHPEPGGDACDVGPEVLRAVRETLAFWPPTGGSVLYRTRGNLCLFHFLPLVEFALVSLGFMIYTVSGWPVGPPPSFSVRLARFRSLFSLPFLTSSHFVLRAGFCFSETGFGSLIPFFLLNLATRSLFPFPVRCLTLWSSECVFWRACASTPPGTFPRFDEARRDPRLVST